MSKSNESKTVKEALKEARDHIDKKDFKTGLKCCKRALNVDKSNYMALVFYGLCSSELEMYDQASQAYKKATDSNPDQLTGWQGFASFIEKKKDKATNEDLQQLTMIYDKMLDFFSKSNDMVKFYATSEKIVTLFTGKLKKIDSAVEALDKRMKVSLEKDKSDKANYARTEIIKILNQNALDLNDDQNQLLKKTLLEVITDDSKSAQNNEHMKILVKLLYNLRDMEELLKLVLKMSHLYPESSYSLEWVCKIYLEYITDTLTFKSEPLEKTIEDHINKLMTLNESSTLAKLANAAFIWKVKNDLKSSCDLLKAIIDGSNNPNFYGLFILCQCYVSLRDLPNAEKSLHLALASLNAKVKEEKTRLKLETDIKSRLAKIQYDQGNYQMVIQTIDENTSDENLKSTLTKTFAHLGNKHKVDELSANLEENTRLLAKAILFEKEGNISEAKTLLEQIPSCFESSLLKAKFAWTSDQDKAHVLFLQAAKADPTSWIPFYYLGEYYKKSGAKQDLDRARKCLQKSYSLNPQSNEAGSSLSDILRIQVSI